MKTTREQMYSAILSEQEPLLDPSKLSFIAARNVIKDFEIGDYIVRAVDQLSLNIAQYEYVAIIGASGAGKTTLLQLLGGLEKVTDGHVHLSFIDISPMSEETLATFRIFNVGFIFQNYNLISSLSAIENIMFPLQLCGTSYEDSEKRARELLAEIGLAEREEHLPFQLSAGEQQRVAIARALANDPPVIIADEPTANVDKKNAEFIATMFEKLRSEGKTIIVATHDEKLIAHAHRILEMDDGKITSDTRVQEISFIPKEEDEDDDTVNETGDE